MIRFAHNDTEALIIQCRSKAFLQKKLPGKRRKERSNHTSKITVLIHEACLKLAENLPLDEALQISLNEKSVDLIALDEASNRLAKLDQRQAKVVELRYFSGLSIDETAEVWGVSNATVRLDWNMAKAWLRQEITK